MKAARADMARAGSGETRLPSSMRVTWVTPRKLIWDLPWAVPDGRVGLAVGWSSSEPVRFAEAVVLLVFADDQVIDEREVEHGGCRFQASRQCHIIPARRRIARGMVVCLMCRRSLCAGRPDRPPFLRVSLRNPDT